jgi:hypothetical protein
MPEDFTSDQRRFLARYLKPIESRIKNKSLFGSKAKRLAKNSEAANAIEKLKGDFALWLEAKDAAQAKIERIALEHDLSKVPEEKAKYEALLQKHASLVVEVRGAPEDKPLFIMGKSHMKLLIREADALNLEIANAIAAVVPVAPSVVFDEMLDKVAEIKEFKNYKPLSLDIAQQRLTDVPSESRRVAALGSHNEQCDAMRVRIEGLRTEFINADDGADFEKQARVGVLSLIDALKSVHSELADAIGSQANAELQRMEAQGDEVAAREVARKGRLSEDAVRIKNAVGKIDIKINTLRQEAKDAKGFQEKRALLAQIKEETDRRNDLQQRALEMEAYEAGASARLKRMVDASALKNLAEDSVAAIDPDGTDSEISSQLSEWAGARPEGSRPLEDFSQLSAKEFAAYKEHVLAKITNLKVAIDLSGKKIVVDAKLYPDEADLTELSPQQADSLMKMLTLAEALCMNKDKLSEAQGIYDDVQALWAKFKEARIFVLPELDNDNMDQNLRIERSLKSIAAMIERLWGMGEDDTRFRAELKRLHDAADLAKEQATAGEMLPDYRSLLADVDVLERQLALALSEAGQPTQADKDAKDAAANASSEIAKKLLSMYRTEPVSEGDLANVHPNDLLVILGPGGEKQYHKITLRDEDTVQRREDKDLPREAIDALRQQMQMLDAMAESDGTGCAEAVEAAAKNAAKMSEAIAEGGPDYKRVKEALVSFDKAMKDSKLQKWRMNGFDPLKAEKEKFEKNYLASMLPADAARDAESLRDQAKLLLVSTGPLSDKHKLVEGVLSSIENKLSAKPSGKDETLGGLLVDLLKKGPAEINTDNLSVQEQMEAFEIFKEIELALKEIKDLGQHGTGVQGTFRTSLGKITKTLDTKSEQGVNKAETDANALQAEVDKALLAAKVSPSTNGMGYLKQILALTKGAADACRKKEEAKDKATALREAANTEVKNTKKALDDATGLSSKVEYTAVYDSLEKQFKNADKAWNKGKGDAEAAVTAFEPIVSNAKELTADLNNLTPVKIGKRTVDLSGFETALKANMQKVATAADSAGTLITKLASQDEEQKNRPELQSNIDKVKAAFAIVATLPAAIGFSSNLQDEINAAFATDASTQKKDMAKVREKVMTEIRRVQDRVEGDPGLAIYRDNPFDHGASWPQFKAALLALETQVLKSLNPGR